MDGPPSEDLTYRSVDWSALAGRRRATPDGRTVAFVASVLAVVAVYLYDKRMVPPRTPIVGQWDPARIDWLFYVALLVVTFYLVVPLYRNRPLTAYYWRRLRTNRLALACFAYLVVFVLGGLVGPPLLGEPEITGATHQPPAFTSVPIEYVAGDCSGPVSGGQCHGTLAHPFGTDGNGQDVLKYVVAGMRVALSVSLVTAVLMVPLAVGVGTVAAHFGGLVDEGLMRYVDLQQVVPPFFIYIVAHFVAGGQGSMLLLVGIFGLLNWGGVARLVRSEALQKNEAGFVKAAQSAGAGRLHVVRGHLVPNVSSTVVTAVTLQIPTIIVVEATVSFLNLAAPGVFSWGNIISVGTQNFPTYWWVVAMPTLFMFATVVSFNLLGDALRDVLDPRAEERTG